VLISADRRRRILRGGYVQGVPHATFQVSLDRGAVEGARVDVWSGSRSIITPTTRARRVLLHSSLDYWTPAAVEQEYLDAA
jgi:hypothetical protein